MIENLLERISKHVKIYWSGSLNVSKQMKLCIGADLQTYGNFKKRISKYMEIYKKFNN